MDWSVIRGLCWPHLSSTLLNLSEIDDWHFHSLFVRRFVFLVFHLRIGPHAPLLGSVNSGQKLANPKWDNFVDHNIDVCGMLAVGGRRQSREKW